MTRLTRFFRLPAADRKVLLKAGALLLGVRLGLWLVPFRVVRWLALGGADGGRKESPLPPERIAWMLAAASRLMPKASCLAHAVAGEALLRRMGYPAALHIGVARGTNAPLEAHAWVECLGTVVIGGSGVERYGVLSRRDPP
jgi:hypothetical protein